MGRTGTPVRNKTTSHPGKTLRHRRIPWNRYEYPVLFERRPQKKLPMPLLLHANGSKISKSPGCQMRKYRKKSSNSAKKPDNNYNLISQLMVAMVELHEEKPEKKPSGLFRRHNFEQPLRKSFSLFPEKTGILWQTDHHTGRDISSETSSGEKVSAVDGLHFRRKKALHSFSGIETLPPAARFDVYIAHMYYLALTKTNISRERMLKSRITIPYRYTAILSAHSIVEHQLNRI